MDGIFCVNFCESRNGLPACRKAWHASCYTCLGIGKFPLRTTEDEAGNAWFKQERRAQRINQGVKGAHASIPFQCEGCWILNLEGRPRGDESNDVYVMCIRRANLDAMGGQAISTIQAHAAAVSRTVQNCRLMGKTPAIPNRGPMPCADELGMGMAVDMLFTSLTARPKLKGEKHIQFDLMQRSGLPFQWLGSRHRRGFEKELLLRRGQ
jgi:hypothetical protein